MVMKKYYSFSPGRVKGNLALILALFLSHIAVAYNPVIISTGFNADVVANGSGAPNVKTTAPFDNDLSEWVLIGQGYAYAPPTDGLPSNGVVNSANTAGLYYQLADYDQNNALQINTTSGSGTLTFQTPVAAADIYLLGASGTGAATLDITVHFVSGPPQTFTGVTLNEWMNGTPYAITGIGRISRISSTYYADATNPRLYDLKLTLNAANWSNPVTGITITRTSASGRVNIMGVTVNNVCSGIPVAGTTQSSPVTICPNTSFTLSVVGATSNSGISRQWQISPAGLSGWSDIPTATNSTYTETGGVSVGTDYRLKLTCANGNGIGYSSTYTVTPPGYFPGGNYTINNNAPASATNFTSFSSAVAAILCGISGAVVFDVAAGSGPYSEQVIIPQIPGASSINTITFNGNGAVLQYTSTNTNERAVIKLDGADHVTIDSLMVLATGNTATQYGFGIHLLNGADSNVIANCVLYTDTTTTASNYAGIVISGAANSATASGSNCNGNTIVNNMVNGGFYGIIYNTCSATVVRKNKLRNFYSYGIYVNLDTDGIIDSNEIYRDTRMGLGAFNGIYQTGAASNTSIMNNRIHTPFGANPSAIGAFQGITHVNAGAPSTNPNKIYNNAIYNIRGGGFIYGIYNISSAHSRYYHNTVVIDDIYYTGSSFARAFHQSGSVSGVELKNNILSITRSGTGVNHGIYKGTALTAIVSNNNDIYINGTGVNHIGYMTTHQTTLSAWQTASNGDMNSISANPAFVNVQTGQVTPTNMQVNDFGTPVGIARDIYGNTRSVTNPDMGAVEFSAINCSGTPTAGTVALSNNLTSVCPGANLIFTLTGNTVGWGISIQWEQSPSGTGMWTPIAGATSNSLSTVMGAPSDYRVVVTCAAGGQFSFSNTVSLQSKPFYECYCSPLTGNVLHANSTLNLITNVNIPTTPLNISTTTVGTGGYTQHPFSTASNTATLTQGQNYTVNVTLPAANNTVEMWVDWNQSGTFDTSEYFLMPSSASPSVNLQVPITAVAGLTGLRLRATATTSLFSIFNKTGACTSVSAGRETEDMVITIAAAIPCTGTPSVTGNIVANSSNSICAGQTVSMSLAGYSQTAGINYQWQSSPSGQNVFTSIAGATDFVYVSSPLSADVDYRVAVSCSNPGGGTAYTSLLTAYVNNPLIVTSAGASRCGTGSVTLSATPVAGADVNWYAAASGGLPILKSSNSFTTPVIASSTTYYAAATNGSQVQTSPMTNTLPNMSTSTYGGIVFNAFRDMTIVSANVYSVNGGTVSVELRDTFGMLMAGPLTFNLIASNYTTPQNLLLNFTVPAGSGYRLLATPSAPLGMQLGNFPLPMGGNVGTISGGTTGATGPAISTNFYFYNIESSVACEGPRFPVTATINTAPAYAIVAAPDTICAGSSTSISLSSANSYVCTWTPTGSGNFFVDAPSNTTTYYVHATDANSCTVYDSVTVVVRSATGTEAAVAIPSAVCISGNVTLSIHPTPMNGVAVQWEKSTGSGFQNIAGATSATYTDAVTTASYYRAKLICGNSTLFTTGIDTVAFYNTPIASTFPGSRCGAGTVVLGAQGVPGSTVRWYTSAIGGLPIGTGNIFPTPPLVTSTNYWAGATADSLLVTAGRISPAATSPAGLGSSAGLVFDAFHPFTINSVDVYPVFASTNINIQLLDKSNNVVQSAGPFYLAPATGATVASGATPQSLTLNFSVAPDTNYKLIISSMIGQVIRDVASANVVFPFSIGSVGNIKSSYLAGNTYTNGYGYLYNWKVTAGCEGTRVPVMATINAAASGTGLVTGGTNVEKVQGANSLEHYVDACGDTAVVITSGSIALDTTVINVLTLPSVPTHGNKPFLPRVYDISPRIDGPATVTLYALQSEFNAYNNYIISNNLNLPLLPTGPSDNTGMGNIVVTQYHGSANAGTQGPLGLYSNANVSFIQNSSITVLPAAGYWKLTFPVTGFSGFFIHTGSNPLAISLKTIHAQNRGSSNSIEWTTGSEHIGDRFELERSANGLDFGKLAEIAAKGQPSGYSYLDEHPVAGKNYYRIRMVDHYGRSSYSNVVMATVTTGMFSVEAYPNPVKDVLTVRAFGIQGNEAFLSITDIMGKEIRKVAMPEGSARIDMSGLAQGMYLLRYRDSEHSATLKITKQ